MFMANSEAKKAANRKYANGTRKHNYISIQIPKTLHAQLKETATQQNCNMIELISKLLLSTYKTN